MRVGINYPWRDYGWDFGPPPAGWRSRDPWRARIAQDLATFRACGISIIRWFVLCDGMTYGTGRDAPRRDGSQWRFDRVPTLDWAVEQDFAELLSHCGDDMQLLPVLIDFHWAFPGLDRMTNDAETLERWRILEPDDVLELPTGYVKGGRGDVIYDPRKRSRFFRRVLEPLLAVSQGRSEAIYAWELINEPEWITRQPDIGGDLPDERRIPLDHMLSFIHEGTATIEAYGFRPTVGFARARTLGDWELRARERWGGTNALGLGVNQIHYYPREGSRLVPASFPNGGPAILGEFATHIDGVTAHVTKSCRGDQWPDLVPGPQGLAARLRYAQAQGYAAALPWSYFAEDCNTVPDHAVIEAGLREFLTPPP